MKKYVLVLFLVILLVAGCAKKVEKSTITCVYDNTLEGNKHINTATIDLENDVVVNAKLVTEYEDETLANKMCSTFKVAEDRDNVTCEGKKITITNYHKSISEDSMSKEEVLKYFQDRRYTCE